jgi:hypothetical protein
MARATATAMADGDMTEMAVAMVDSNRNGNGQRQWQRQWAIATATAMVTATDLAIATEMPTAMAMATATARATITKEGLPLHVAAMCSAFGGATPCLHPHGHTGKCMCHGGDTAKSGCSPSRGRVPDSSPWIVFCLFFTTTVQFTEHTSVCPPPIIQVLKNPVSRLALYLLYCSKNPVSLLTIYPGSYCTFLSR